MGKSRTPTLEGQPMTVSESAPRVSVKDRLGPTLSIHASTASKRSHEDSRPRAVSNVKRKLVFTAEKGYGHGRRRVEGTSPRTRYRDDQDEKASRLAKMADEADRAMEVLVKQRQDIAEQISRMAELRDEASSYVQSEERGHRSGKEPAHSERESRGQPRERRRSISPTPHRSKRAHHLVGFKEQDRSERRDRSRERTPENTKKALVVAYSHHISRAQRRSRSRGRTPESPLLPNFLIAL